jgi:hypothetical protein
MAFFSFVLLGTQAKAGLDAAKQAVQEKVSTGEKEVNIAFFFVLSCFAC